MEYVIQLLKNHQKTIYGEIDLNNSRASLLAANVINEQIYKAIKILEYECYWKDIETDI